MNQNEKKMLIYPFTAETIPYINYISHFRLNWLVNDITSFIGSGLIGKDVGVADNRFTVGSIVKEYSENLLSRNDLIIIFHADNNQIQEHALAIMMQAFHHKKDVICIMKLEEDTLEDMLNLAKENNVKFEYLVDVDAIHTVKHVSKAMYTPSVPVAFVGGLIDCANQNEVTLAIAGQLKEQGISVSVLGYDDEYSLLGQHSYKYVFNNNSLEHEKIREFNQLVKAVAEIEKPDIILVQLNGTMLRFNDILTNDFGVYAYMFSQAILPDYFVCCSMYGMYDADSFIKISEYFQNRFLFKIDCVHISNAMLDIAQSIEMGALQYINVSPIKVDEYLDEQKMSETIPIYNILKKENLKSMIDNMLRKLICE